MKPENALAAAAPIVMGVIFVAVLIALSIRGARLTRQDENRAIAHCRTLGGEPILTYSYNSDAFSLTGCKLK